MKKEMFYLFICGKYITEERLSTQKEKGHNFKANYIRSPDQQEQKQDQLGREV